jgi:formamidopyrimidine-DNA glycosylase
MPELPEVETVRRTLLPSLVGRRITGVMMRAFPGVIGQLDPETFAGLVSDRHITDIRRRGKYLLIDLDDESGLIVHLRMTGNLSVLPVDAEQVRFEHISLLLDDGQTLRFSDQRKFGRIEYRPAEIRDPLRSKLGPEPLGRGFTAAYLAGKLKGRTAAIKALILDQRIIAGVGNIYADEALFRSRIHPLTPGGELSTAQVASLVRSIKGVLRSGIEHRGTTFSSYRDANGEAGGNQFRLRVYGRGRRGEPCPRCGQPLVTLVAGGRTSHVCLHCQPLPASADSAATR